MKTKKLPTLLEGEALAVWLELSAEQQASYDAAKAKITKAMAPVQFVSLDDFRARKLRPNEALSVFLHELRQMLKQAIPEAVKVPGNSYYCTNLLADYPLTLASNLEQRVHSITWM